MGKASTEQKELLRRKKISDTMRKNKKSGGLRIGSGRGIKGWYKGFYCRSSYELAFVIYYIDNNIDIKQNFEGFKYYYNGKQHLYYPDFIINDEYYEIKGFKRENDGAKWNYFPHKLNIFFKKDLKNVLEYVIKKYGENYISLYEDIIIRVCKMCNGKLASGNKNGICQKCISKNKKIRIHKKRIPRKIYHCIGCGNKLEKYRKSGKCKKCYKQKIYFSISRDEFRKLLPNYSYVKIGDMYNVSDKTVKKWAIKYNLV